MWAKSVEMGAFKREVQAENNLILKNVEKIKKNIGEGLIKIAQIIKEK